MPGELKLRITDAAPGPAAHGHRDRHRRHAVPGRLGHRAADRAPPRRPPAGAPAGRGAPRAAGQARPRSRPRSSPTTRSTATSSRAGCAIEIDPVRDRDGREQLRQRAAPGADRRARGGRGLAEDAPAGPRRSPTSWPARAPPTPARRCRTRTSPTRSSCCAGSPTTTSRSSATASTGSSTGRRRGGPPRGRARHRSGHPAAGPDHAARAVLDDPRGVRSKVLEKRLLIITKANSRATVHRSAYLDYIGVQDLRRQRRR